MVPLFFRRSTHGIGESYGVFKILELELPIQFRDVVFGDDLPFGDFWMEFLNLIGGNRWSTQYILPQVLLPGLPLPE